MSSIMFPPPVNPSDLGRGPAIVAVTWTLTFIATVAVAMRFYVRKKVVKSLAWEDWLMLVALIFQFVYQAFLQVSFSYGMGKHDADLALPDEMVNILKWNWWSLVPGTLVSIFARISAAILLIRLFGVHAWFTWFMIILTTLQTVVSIALVPCVFLQSTPVSGLWNIFDFTATHWDPRIVLYMQYIGQSLFTLADLTYVLFPVIIVWRLNMPIRQRLGLMALMTASLVAMMASILKVIAVQGSSHIEADVQYNASLEMLWVGMEQALVIIVGCVPALRKLVKLDSFIYVSESLSSLLRRRGEKSKMSSSDNDVSGAYTDLELSTSKLGDLTGKRGAPTTVISHQRPSQGSEERLAPGDAVWRRDQFQIVYQRDDDATA